MRATIDARLASPQLYTQGDGAEAEALRRKRAEVVDGLRRAEALWMAALERLEAAGEHA
jgi:ATP-binding cassette subfamily F protein 3